ncbi:MAG: protein-export chaperone SecB [Sphingomonadales bacterium]|nr:protein-export chaperone SecB [Sphingomonadales bacterium]
MADNENTNDAAATADDSIGAGVLAQYVKDLSFENPNAPQSLQGAKEAPSINVNVNVNGNKVADDTYEVELKVSITATEGENSVFVVELVYAGLFGLRNFPEDQLQPFLLVQAPMLLFPYARRVISDAVRDGGFPPLMLEPIDFMGLYQQQLQAAAQQGDAPAN